MTDPNDTPALDLDALEASLKVEKHSLCAVGFIPAPTPATQDIPVLVGDLPSPAAFNAARNLRACVARIRADAARITALEAERDDAVRFRDAYKRAKAENDERFMLERDEARQERDAALARVRELEADLAAERAHSADLRAREQHGVLNLRTMADECAKAVAAAEQRVRAEERERSKSPPMR